MSTVKSSSENLTLNADGVGSDVVIQNNGTETVRIDSSGTVTATAFSGDGSALTGVGGGDLVDDTTPQLGGDLDLNSNDITGGGAITITGHIVAGEGSGGTSLTHNDGGGNANVCFNHRNQIPEQNGNAGRIDVNTDSSTNCHMTFQLAQNVTSGVSVSATNVMELYQNGEWHINAGYGSKAQAFAVRAWGNITPTTTINGSGNVSSVSRTGTGTYRINFTNAMPDANYSVVAIGNDNAPVIPLPYTLSTTFCQLRFYDTGGSLEDFFVRYTFIVVR